jgi:hypothetical protein
MIYERAMAGTIVLKSKYLFIFGGQQDPDFNVEAVERLDLSEYRSSF